MFIIETRRKLMNVSITFLVAGFVFYFAYHMISGEKGVLAMIKLQQRVAAAHEEYADIHADRQRLERRVTRLSPKSLDTDLLDEQARRQLGQAGPDEIMLMPGASSPALPPLKAEASR